MLANTSRARKRVHAIRRAADGSAFEKCGQCGVMVAIALADMHECETKKEFKRFKGIMPFQNRENASVKLINKAEYDESKFADEPRSAFRFFMETYRIANNTKNFWEIDTEGFEKWKNMSKEERQPYILKAEEVDKAYRKVLLREMNGVPEVEGGADAAVVGKLNPIYEECKDEGNFCSDRIQFISPKFRRRFWYVIDVSQLETESLFS